MKPAHLSVHQWLCVPLYPLKLFKLFLSHFKMLEKSLKCPSTFGGSCLLSNAMTRNLHHVFDSVFMLWPLRCCVCRWVGYLILKSCGFSTGSPSIQTSLTECSWEKTGSILWSLILWLKPMTGRTPASPQIKRDRVHSVSSSE